MFEVSKQFHFSAGHRLSGLPDGHPCRRIHGHSYRAEVRVQARDLTGPGFVADYGDLAPFGAWLDTAWDHRWLGTGILTDETGTKTEPVFDGNPTAEELAACCRRWCLANLSFPKDCTVEAGISETAKTWAWAR